MAEEDLELIRLLIEIKKLEALIRLEDLYTNPPKQRTFYATNVPKT